MEEAGEASPASCDLKREVQRGGCIPGQLQAGVPERHSSDVDQQGLGPPASRGRQRGDVQGPVCLSLLCLAATAGTAWCQLLFQDFLKLFLLL